MHRHVTLISSPAETVSLLPSYEKKKRTFLNHNKEGKKKIQSIQNAGERLVLVTYGPLKPLESFGLLL